MQLVSNQCQNGQIVHSEDGELLLWENSEFYGEVDEVQAL
jgi:hypothetical protein